MDITLYHPSGEIEIFPIEENTSINHINQHLNQTYKHFNLLSLDSELQDPDIRFSELASNEITIKIPSVCEECESKDLTVRATGGRRKERTLGLSQVSSREWMSLERICNMGRRKERTLGLSQVSSREWMPLGRRCNKMRRRKRTLGLHQVPSREWMSLGPRCNMKCCRERTFKLSQVPSRERMSLNHPKSTSKKTYTSRSCIYSRIPKIDH